jgi:hypothetical protein
MSEGLNRQPALDSEALKVLDLKCGSAAGPAEIPAVAEGAMAIRFAALADVAGAWTS